MKPKVIAILVLALLLIIILVQNLQTINFNVLFWSFGLSKLILILLSAVIGFIAGYLTFLLATKRR